MLVKTLLQDFKYSLLIFILLVTLLMLQYKIFFGKNNVFTVLNLQKNYNQKQQELHKLKYKNQKLAMKVEFLKQDPSAYEEHARYTLGMKKPKETYYQVVVPLQ